MFRISAAIAAVCIIAGGVTPILPPSPAHADANPAVDLCREVLVPLRPNSNLGECVSYINAAANDSGGEASHFCDFLIENDPDTFELLFVSKPECIQAYGDRGHGK
jgi:hypothetical protein